MSSPLFEPLSDLMTLRQAMDQLFEQSVVAPHGSRDNRGGVRAIPLDLYQTKEAYILQANIPGVNPNEVEITLDGDTLTIHGETKPPAQAEGYLIQERRFGPFERVVRLDLPIQSDKIDAAFDNGVLTLTLPKAESVKPKKIKVKTS